MNDERWNELLVAIRQTANIERMVVGSASLQAESSEEDVPRLVALLEDSDFVVREAAAWPLSDLGRVEAFPQLLQAYQRGIDDGHDNDGLSAALIDLLEMNESTARPILHDLSKSDDPRIARTAAWLLTFGKVSHDT